MTRRAVNIQQPPSRDAAAFAAAFEPWLRDALGWREATIIEVSRPSGAGSSNESVAVTVRQRDGRMVDLVVRIVGQTVTTYYDPDIERQAASMRWVSANTAVPVPDVVGVERTSNALGGPFMVMRRLPGEAPSDYPGYNIAGFLADGSPAFRRAAWDHAIDALCALHVVDITGIDFLGAGPPSIGLSQLVAYWRSSLEWMAASCDVSEFDPLLSWLEDSIPPAAPVGLSWGDARIANMLFVGTEVTGVLDWEMVSRGGPLVDLAWWLMFDTIHSVDFGVSRLEGLGSREETIDRWCAGTGHSVADLTWHEIFVHIQLCLGRTTAFAQRARAGLPVPGPDDARSVANLRRRIDDLLALH